ncbi:MAG: MAPEG family protein [Pseudomonadota bacterium]
MTPELTYLALAVILMLVHMSAQAGLAVLANGIAWGMSPRDYDTDAGKPASRAARALMNYAYNFPAFAALALAVTMAGVNSDSTALGAMIWFWARVIYLPCYIFAVPVLRSVAWLTSVAGLIMMLLPLLSGGGAS